VKAFLGNGYRYLITIPDRLYPFKREIEGKWVRGQRSYEAAVNDALEKYGLGKLGYKLTLYRETFHFVGSLLFIVFATLIAKNLFGSDAALYVLLLLAMMALAYQEFYLHPRTYGQLARKGVTDWLVWAVPMIIYLTLFNK
jgi:hypothetical protein